MRIWVDPDKMLGLSLTSDDITTAISAQNAQVAAGRIGAQPNPITQQISATVLVKGQLTSPEEFGAIVLRANPDGSSVRLRDVARIEVGAESYNFRDTHQRQAGCGRRHPAVADRQRAGDVRGSAREDGGTGAILPRRYRIRRFPTTRRPSWKSRSKRSSTRCVEAMVLVFAVMFLFLQNFRYTIIPTLVVPVALLGTCAVMLATGFSINVLTMFAMVLAIGILVDDAIVVVENVERIMAEEGLPPQEATRKAMTQISGAIIGITLVLTAVFVPMAFFPGAVGVIYRQFSLTMVISILFSGFLALSLTPALCATFLKPMAKGHHEKKGFFGWFNRNFDNATRGYSLGRRLDRYAGQAASWLSIWRCWSASAGRSCSFRPPSCRTRTRAL